MFLEVLNDSLKLADIACPPLFPPRHGYLECSRPIDEIADGPSGGSLKITNRPGSQCILKCPTGYRLEGKFSKICGTTGEWIGDENGTCIRYPQPKLLCPTSVNVELHPNETETTTVRLRRPETDVSWERDVQVEPFWVKKDSFSLPLGSLNVSYSAKHPVSKLHTECNFLINVLPGSPPRVDFCPDTQVYTIEGRHQSVKATWEEPVFSDNVGVVTITKSNSPGTDFGAGSHLITYEAHDDAEWKSKCVFKIVVNVNPEQQQQPTAQSHFQLPILYNRFYF
uniref:HYR domain-containing protein n=1 Tax=Anopheles culicifacies TaxID=139723 RepID=A0A182MC95_9DIPT